ncbi:MAG: monooxygenase [Deltaproteobacteria bacterium]|nr:monooxygenase [Deltaproteobacteria bacterium]
MEEQNGDRPELEVAIVGAGMSGMAMAIELRKAGIENFRIFEKADSIGGTWRENRYPGLSCDVPSFFYSYSFEPNLDWTHRFSPGHEILAYFKRVAEKCDLLRSISFGESVERASYEDGAWTIETSAGNRCRAEVLVAATGPLHHKNYPEIEGLDSFEGAQFHSADWDDDLDLNDKRIGVIGNGSTGVQMMRPLSEKASQLTMFQRTAQWVFPIGNKPYSEGARKWKRRLPILARITREFYKRLFEMSSVGVVEEGYFRRRMAKGCRDHVMTIEDPELRAKLTPDYEPGCKRLILSTDFYPTMAKEHVDLVTEDIARIEPRGVVTSDGALHELDVLVLATGFNAHAWGVEQVTGIGGRSLKDAWAQGTRTYRAITIPDFPNFFMLAGPNSPLGNISVIDVAETQSRYIVDCIRRLKREPGRVMVPKRAAAEAFHAELIGAMKGTIWVSGCNSWYLDGDGFPVLWPWSARRFHDVMRSPEFEDYEFMSA